MADNKKAPKMVGGINNFPNNIIPQELKNLKLFVGYDAQKRPINPATGRFANSTDSATCGTFEEAEASLQQYKNIVGLGIVLGETEQGTICGLDIDNCFDEEGNIAPVAQDIIDALNTYTEFSPSKKGIHCLFYAEKKGSSCKVSNVDGCKCIEMYDTGRYFTLTGDVLNNKSIENRQMECDCVYDMFFEPFAGTKPKEFNLPTNCQTDEKLLKSGLKRDAVLKSYWDGDRPFEDESSNDMGFMSKLMFWCNNNVDLAISSFVSSPYASQKDDKHIKKMYRADYLPRIANKCLTQQITKSNDYVQQQEKIGNANPLLLLKGISAVNEAKNYEYVVPGLLAKNFVSVLYGEPGCGKTWTLIDLGLNLSNGLAVFNDIEVQASKVLLFEGDAPDSLLKERINRFDIEQNDKYFKYVNRFDADRNGIDITLTTKDGRNNFEAIVADFMPALVIVDTLISFIDDEKDAKEMKEIVDFLRRIAEEYNCHILICHHSRKREAGEKKKKLDQADVIGSSVIIRLASVIIGMDNHEENSQKKILNLKKSWFRPFDALLFEVQDTSEGKIEIIYEPYIEAKTKNEEAVSVISNYIKTTTNGEFTRKKLVDTFNNIPETTIKKALKIMEDQGYITSEGHTINRVFKVNTPQF